MEIEFIERNEYEKVFRSTVPSFNLSRNHCNFKIRSYFTLFVEKYAHKVEHVH